MIETSDKGLVRGFETLIVKQAVVNFEIGVRDAIGKVAIRLADYYTIERIGSELVIHVKIEAPR